MAVGVALPGGCHPAPSRVVSDHSPRRSRGEAGLAFLHRFRRGRRARSDLATRSCHSDGFARAARTALTATDECRPLGWQTRAPGRSLRHQLPPSPTKMERADVLAGTVRSWPRRRPGSGAPFDGAHGGRAPGRGRNQLVAEGRGELHHPGMAPAQVHVGPPQADHLAHPGPRPEEERPTGARCGPPPSRPGTPGPARRTSASAPSTSPGGGVDQLVDR